MELITKMGSGTFYRTAEGEEDAGKEWNGKDCRKTEGNFFFRTSVWIKGKLSENNNNILTITKL